MADPRPQPPLDAAGWARVSALFDTARDLPPGDLPAWLARLDQDEPAAAPLLRQMLQAHASRSEDDWLERGPRVDGGTAALPRGLGPGARVGPWVLGGLLGSGGMATVWRATRADALPAREVALKLPLAHRAGTQLAERFARERDILARLTHPHIAPLYDAGVAEDGTPWLAMECVDGEPLDRWCDTRRLPLHARLDLYAQVLEAVQHAHSRGVIHRDLKPGNILVTPEGQARLLDFGIARLLDDATAPGTQGPLTQAAGTAMTPAYAAPEQVRGEAPTTATDIYALGVVLFELLAGQRPYRTRLDTPAQLEQAIAQGDLRRASEAVTADAARHRDTTLRRLAAELRGDLDTILAKALHADARQRYASAAEFAADLRRHQAGEPVLARPGSAAYRLRRFVARHRVPVLAAAFALVALVGGLVASVLQAQRADRERDAALAMRGRFRAVTFFLTDQLMASALSGRALTASETLARAEAAARSEFADEPDALAHALLFIGGQRRVFEGAARGEHTVADALRVVRDPTVRAELECDRGAALYSLGRADEGIAAIEHALQDASVSPATRASCTDYQALLLNARGDLAAALRAQERSAALYRTAPDTTRFAQQRNDMMLAYLRAMNGSSDDPEPVFEAAWQRLREAGREQTLPGQELRTRWAAARMAGGDAAGALPLIEQNRRNAQAQGVAQAVASFLRAEGAAREALGQDDEALAAYEGAAAAAAAASDPRQRAASSCLAVPALLRRGDAAQARSRQQAGLQALPAGGGALDEPARACAMAAAELALARRDTAAADAALQPLLAEPRLAPHLRGAALLLQARVALAAGDAAQALAHADAALALAQRLQGQRPTSFRTAAAQAMRTQALAAQPAGYSR